MGRRAGGNPPFEMDSRSKRSIVLDLTTDGGLAAARQLRAGADVFITNARPDALSRLDLDYLKVAAINPGLVYVLITGYGEKGPEANRSTYDFAAFWARSGVADLLTRPGDSPPFQRGGMGDHMTGITLAAAVNAALVARTRTGEGQLVTTSLYRQGTYTVSFDLNTFLLSGRPIAIGQRETLFNPCMNNYLAVVVPGGGASGVVERQPVYHRSRPCDQLARAHRHTRRDLRDQAVGGVGADLRHRARSVLVAGELDGRRSR